MFRFLIRFVFVGMLAALPAVTAIGPVSRAHAQDASSPTGVSLPIIGELQGDAGETGTFQGTVSQLVASDEGEVVLSGVLNGLARVGDDTVRVENQPFSSPVTPSVVGAIPAEEYQAMRAGGDTAGTPDDATGTPAAMVPSESLDATTFQFFQTAADEGKCDVLYLNLEPITLNLLGLELLTSQITLDVNAIPGEGNLLGNLVCSLAGLLDGTPDAIAEITNQLNELLATAGVAPTETPTSETPAVEATTAATTVPATTEPTVAAAEATAAPTEPAEAPTEPAAAPTTVPAEPAAPEDGTPVG
jgi:cell division septation protein DedD